MSDKGKFYMTTAIAYTSGKPHIGNTYEMRSRVIRDWRATMFISRPEQMSMARRFRRRQKKQALRQKSM